VLCSALYYVRSICVYSVLNIIWKKSLTEKNFDESGKSVFLPKFMIAHYSISQSAMLFKVKASVCEMSLWKHFKHVLHIYRMLFYPKELLYVSHPYTDCIHMPLKGASISKAILCSCFVPVISAHAGCKPHLHLVDL